MLANESIINGQFYTGGCNKDGFDPGNRHECIGKNGTIPNRVSDGDYVSSFSSIGGFNSDAVPTKQLPLYRNCANIRVQGGTPLEDRPANWVAPFIGGSQDNVKGQPIPLDTCAFKNFRAEPTDASIVDVNDVRDNMEFGLPDGWAVPAKALSNPNEKGKPEPAAHPTSLPTSLTAQHNAVRTACSRVSAFSRILLDSCHHFVRESLRGHVGKGSYTSQCATLEAVSVHPASSYSRDSRSPLPRQPRGLCFALLKTTPLYEFLPRDLFITETDINRVLNRSDVVQPLVGAHDTFDIAVTVWQLATFEEQIAQYLDLHPKKADVNEATLPWAEVEDEAAYLYHEAYVKCDGHQGTNYDLQASFVIVPHAPSPLGHFKNFSSWFPAAVNRELVPSGKPLLCIVQKRHAAFYKFCLTLTETRFPIISPTEDYRRPVHRALDSFAMDIPLIERHEVPSVSPPRMNHSKEDLKYYNDYPEDSDIRLKYPHAVTRSASSVNRDSSAVMGTWGCTTALSKYILPIPRRQELAVPDPEAEGGFRDEFAYALYMDVLQIVAGPKLFGDSVAGGPHLLLSSRLLWILPKLPVRSRPSHVQATFLFLGRLPKHFRRPVYVAFGSSSFSPKNSSLVDINSFPRVVRFQITHHVSPDLGVDDESEKQ
ncbi:hypothetical protein DFH09DRAFT_1094374 [Mycena vulgaris]|nr:hypothetical protein DFH09DRAFT_1094374 [Mycena vulgaris]